MNLKLTLVLVVGLMTGCLIPVQVGSEQPDGGSGGGDAGPSGPDLIVALIQAPSTAVAGSTISFLRTIKNIGNADARANKYLCFLSASPTIPSDGPQDKIGEVLLMAGASDTASDPIRLAATLAPGTYYIGCVADWSSVVAETNEQNNTLASNPIQITAAVDGGSDGGTDAGVVCSTGANGSCNDDLNMSAIAGTCVANACNCNSGFEINPATGRCKLYYARYPISSVQAETYALAIEPGQNRAGLAWIAAADAGSYDVFYRDWLYSAPGGSPPEHLATVQAHAGIAVAFRGSQPVVSFLGGGSDGSASWTQSDAVILERSAAGTWQAQTVATMSNQANCANLVSEAGFLVGLWPALAIDGAKTFLAWRDGHGGQFPQQDWASSDLELAETSTGGAPWTTQCAKAGGVDKTGPGQSSKIVIAGGQPALIYTHGTSGVRDASDVSFVQRTAAGWQTPVKLFADQAVMSPVADWLGFAHNATTGYAVVAGNANLGRATLITTSSDGMNWLLPSLVGNSAGGADVAIGANGLLQVSVVDCPKPIGAACTAPSELAVSIWTEALVGAVGLNFTRGPLVDPQGANGATRLGIFANGKRAVLYESGIGFELRLAVER